MTSAADLSAVEASARLAAGKLTAVALTRACLERIAGLERAVRAWEHVDPDTALRQAEQRDAEARPGPLHGVPVGVKDIIDTADLPTCYGSPHHAGHQPASDAGIVSWLRGQGAVILGKTVTTEFATFHPGPTTNPHDPTRTPGGSSSGSAAAVAAGMVPLALATQTAGSIVRPAAFCGIAGLKPSFGTWPLAGVRAVAPTLDTLGVLARDVDDLALFAGVDLTADAPPPRLGFLPTAQWDAAEPSTREILGALAERLELPRIDLAERFSGLPAAQETIMAREALDTLGPERERGAVSAELEQLLDAGAAVADVAHEEALELGRACAREWPAVLAAAGCDAVLTPAVVGEAPVGLHTTGDPLFCRGWTLLGVPCVAVPGLTGPAGMPLGVQVVAASGADAVALAAARWLAERLP